MDRARERKGLKRDGIRTDPDGQRPGIDVLNEDFRIVGSMNLDPGHIDPGKTNPQPPEGPFGPRSLPMSWVRSATHVSGPDGNVLAERGGFEPPKGC